MPPRAETRRGQAPIIELPWEFKQLPQSVQEGIQGVVSLYRKDREGPKTVRQMNQLIPDINVLVQEYFDSLGQFKAEDMTWSEVRNGLRVRAREKAIKTGREQAWDYHQKTYLYGIGVTYEDDIALTAGRWETVADQEGFDKNPYIPLLKLYKLAQFKFDWGIARVAGEDEKEMLILRGPLDGIKNKFGDDVDVLLPYTEDGAVCEGVTFVVDSKRPMSAVRLLVPAIEISDDYI